MTSKEMHFDDGPNALAVGLHGQPGLGEVQGGTGRGAAHPGMVEVTCLCDRSPQL